MTTLYLYDDEHARHFEPFASTRPVGEMRAGAALIRERWCALIPNTAVEFLAGPRAVDFEEPDAPHAARGVVKAGSIVVNTRCVPALPTDAARRQRRAATISVWRCAARVAAVRVLDDIDSGVFDDGSASLDTLTAMTGDVEDVNGWWHDEVWDFIRLLPDELRDDLEKVAATSPPAGAVAASRLPAHVVVIGDHATVLLGEGEHLPSIEPHVVLDASNGPIVVDRGAVIHAFTRLNGPCYIGPKVAVMGGEIGTCSIGPVCKVRGEMSNTVMLGYSNKGHDGFIGHSYLGRWVNIGASTVTSNLKNTYGSVALWTPRGIRDTGMQFLGTLFGDHVKTGIGLKLTTGTVIGAGANIYGSPMPPKVVPPFAWGDAEPYSVYRVDKFLETASRMMARRKIAMTEQVRRHLAAAHAARWHVENNEL